MFFQTIFVFQDKNAFFVTLIKWRGKCSAARLVLKCSEHRKCIAAKYRADHIPGFAVGTAQMGTPLSTPRFLIMIFFPSHNDRILIRSSVNFAGKGGTNRRAENRREAEV